VPGFAWFEDPADLVRRPHECERGVDEAVRAFLADQEADRERVFLVGEGYGATVAFDVALRAPGLFRGVLMVDGPIHPDTPLDLARRAAALGLRTALLSFEGAPKAPTEASSKGSDAKRWLEACGFSAPVVHADPGATSTDRSNRLRQTLESWFR
jgi:pimeloyl-ACP methyl ester carboxylesterase